MSATDLYLDGPLSTRVPQIDAEHAQLHVMAAELDHILTTSVSRELRLEKHKCLYEAFAQHFVNEERIMAELGVETLKIHVKRHEELLGELSNLGKSISSEHERTVTEKFVAIERLLVTHIASLDTDIRHYLERE
jgi:hemerythrin-like metal-binding protein